ncbi:MAG: sugar isomerase domain-containing protein [Elusimicrobiota bacterium]|jgi:uncharacterized phosphosugar-binding protein|nr:sugar isomerase domain-containing protein [Elusimicrobiota bacterium]
MSLKNPYFKEITKLLEKIEQTQSSALAAAATAAAQTVKAGGIIYTLGSGHSHSVALEPFHRSGTLACISAVLDESFNFRPTAHAATEIERLEGYTPVLLRRHDIKKKDIFIIISNSGRNPAGIDAAIYAKKAGAKIIVITALSAHKTTRSRHSSGKMLRDFGDIVIDNCVRKQETALKLNGKDIAPVSTIAGAAIINDIMYNAARLLSREGFAAPLYLSSNDGGDENNAKLAARYKGRIVFLS